jgi:hypothetical protein
MDQKQRQQHQKPIARSIDNGEKHTVTTVMPHHSANQDYRSMPLNSLYLLEQQGVFYTIVAIDRLILMLFVWPFLFSFSTENT